MSEIWKPVKEYEGLYEVSNLGRVRRLEGKVPVKTECSIRQNIHVPAKILKPTIYKNGYMYASLSRHNICKRHLVHRLVAEAFIENPDLLPLINHKDENKLNNNAENLEWCTAKYNANYGTKTERWAQTCRNKKCLKGKNPKKVYQYDKENNFIKEYNSASEAAECMLGNAHTIRKAISGRYKTAYGFVWKYSGEVTA